MFQSVSVVVAVIATIVVVSMVPYGDAKSIGEKHGEILRANRQEAFRYRRQPEYAESNHFTVEETQAMRAARRKRRGILKAMGISEQNPNAKIFTESSPVVVDEEQVNEHVGINLFEGDIVLTKGQEEILQQAKEGGARQQAFLLNMVYRWDDGVVPYVLDKSLNDESIDAIFDAMDELELKSDYCVWFQERNSEKDYIRLISDDGCSSSVGMIGGVQEVSIENTDPEGYTCATKGIAMHELFHALGRFHEQNRPDRDDYVTVDKSNVASNYVHNFDKQPASVASTQNQGYDFKSIMHYGSFDFALNQKKPVITSKTGDKITGQREYLTEKDINHLKLAYC